MKNARELAADILCEVEKGAKSNECLSNALDTSGLSDSDRHFVSLLVQGTLEKLLSIDEILSAYSKNPIIKLRPIVRNVLRISVYQLEYLANIPQSAVCNEAVKIIERRKIYGLKAYVNAVLRSCCNNISNENNISVPKWIADIIYRRGGDKADVVLRSLDESTPLICRYNLSKACAEEITKELADQSIKSEHVAGTLAGYELTSDIPVSQITAFQKGFIQIQNVSSIIAAEKLSPNKGDKVLDICAAPGGKSIALADMVGVTGVVLACDLTPKKIGYINSNVERCGFSQVTTAVRDACEYFATEENAYDCVLADLPCSGLGTIGHKKEIRFRITPEKVKELSTLQKRILDNAVRYVKTGGKLLYSTCTITYEENEENTEYIQKLGLKLLESRQFLSGIDQKCDGFYYALFEK